ncbi:hypothetical protein TWF730_004714 [Orbilia blumenaviensis]|uniref:Uncharacterized protein n=1 Tax=Orbilia blumenaviensis TaxID=1796055 RepID=A0AAV9TWT2_9PEZI
MDSITAARLAALEQVQLQTLIRSTPLVSRRPLPVPYFENSAKETNQIPSKNHESQNSSPNGYAISQSEVKTEKQYLRQENALSSSSPSSVTSPRSESLAATGSHGLVRNTESSIRSPQSTAYNLELSATGPPHRPQESMPSYPQRIRQNNYETRDSTTPKKQGLQALEHSTNSSYPIPLTVHGPDGKSSDSSEDSFIQVERLKFYSNKVKEAMRAENWIEAEESQACIFEILLHRDDCVNADWYIDGATISYMLGNLEEAKKRLASIPKTTSTDSTMTLKCYCLESTILIQGKEYDSAYTTCKRAAKLARKSNLPEYTHLAYYLLQRLFAAQGDIKEADFYKQLIQPGFEVPNYAKPLENEPRDPKDARVLPPQMLNTAQVEPPVTINLAEPPTPVSKKPDMGRIYESTHLEQDPAYTVVVGVDFGVSNSVIAWASSLDPDKIMVIDKWPSSYISAGSIRSEHVPSEVFYPFSSSVLWGYTIPSKEKSVTRFKLLLESNDPTVAHGMDVPGGLNPEDIVTDFLRGLYIHIIDTICQKEGKLPKIDFTLTVPAMWTEHSRAAAVYCISILDTISLNLGPTTDSFVSAAKIKANSRVVVCSVGDCVVDLVTYNCLEVAPNLELKECAVRESGFCGLSKVDRNFTALFERRMGNHLAFLTSETKAQALKNFGEIRPGFRDRPDQDTYNVLVPGVKDLHEAGIENGELILTRGEVRSLFDPVVAEIITLIHNQIKGSPKKTGRYNNIYIFLIGDEYGCDLYLYKRVKEWANPYAIPVMQSSDSYTAAAKGAVIRGLEDIPDLPKRANYQDGALPGRKPENNGSQPQGPASDTTFGNSLPPAKPKKPTRLLGLGNLWK